MRLLPAKPITKETLIGGRPYDLDNYDALTVEYAKVLNYFRHDLAEDFERDWKLLAAGQSNPTGLLALHAKAGSHDKALFLHKKLDSEPWGLDNLELRDTPSCLLGARYEGYLTCNGAIVTIRQASRFLCIEEKELIRLKLWLILDERVIAEAIKRMLKPRPLWAKVKA